MRLTQLVQPFYIVNNEYIFPSTRQTPVTLKHFIELILVGNQWNDLCCLYVVAILLR